MNSNIRKGYVFVGVSLPVCIGRILSKIVGNHENSSLPRKSRYFRSKPKKKYCLLKIRASNMCPKSRRISEISLSIVEHFPSFITPVYKDGSNTPSLFFGA